MWRRRNSSMTPSSQTHFLPITQQQLLEGVQRWYKNVFCLLFLIGYAKSLSTQSLSKHCTNIGNKFVFRAILIKQTSNFVCILKAPSLPGYIKVWTKLLERFLAFFLPCYRSLGVENAYFIELKRQRALFSLPLATPNSAPPGMTLLKVFNFVQWEPNSSNCNPLKSISGTQRQP